MPVVILLKLFFVNFIFRIVRYTISYLSGKYLIIALNVKE